MKKVHILVAAVMLVAGAANAQTGTRAQFRALNCLDCTPTITAPRLVDQTNPNQPLSQASVDNSSQVIQGGSGTSTGNDNIAIVDQAGAGNAARLTQTEGNFNYGLQVQTGNSNKAVANIYGSENTTLQFQQGDGNEAGINVDEVNGSIVNGERNWAQQSQNGTRNLAVTNQYGDQNVASQSQSGTSNSGNIFQHTNSSLAVQEQMGFSNTASTLQGHSGVGVGSSIPVGDNNQRSFISQGGDRNAALVTQDARP